MRDSRALSSSGAVAGEEIFALIRENQPVATEDLIRLLSGKLPDGLSDAQKLARLQPALRHLVDVGRVRKLGSRRYPLWGVA